MANLNKMFPQTTTLVSSATITTNTTNAATSLPSAQSYRLIAQVNTVSGTSPTLVVILATSFDGGTTYNDVISTSTISTTGQGQQVCFKAYLGDGDAATTQATALTSAVNLAAAVVNNGPINPQYVKVKYVVSGTSPSFSSVTVGVIADALGAGSP